MKHRRPSVLALAAALVACAAWTQPQDAKGLKDRKGAVRIDGSSTVYPISEAVAEEFSKAAPGVKVTVGMSGTGGGFKRFGAGETDISNASRAIKKSEAEACKAKGIEFIELPIAFDGLTLVTNRANTWAKQLTVEQVKRIFSADGSARAWKDLDPSWPADPIKVYSPGTDSGTFDYFREVVVGKDGKIRPDISVSEDDNVLVRGVEGDKNAIGFFGFAYYLENKAKLNALAVVSPATGQAVLPSHDTIERGTYAPFSRPLFIYVSKGSLENPAVAAFARFALDRGPELAEEVGYVKMPVALYDRARANLASRKAGTQMTDDSGRERTGPLSETYR